MSRGFYHSLTFGLNIRSPCHVAPYVIIWVTLGSIREVYEGYYNSFVSNCKLARATWGELPRSAIRTLKALTEKYGLLVSTGIYSFSTADGM